MIKKNNVIIKDFGLVFWEDIFNKMNYFTVTRNQKTDDEIWFVEHYPIFTQGQSEYNNKIRYIKNIPVVHTNRGGKITYHGPGQQIIYLLLDLKRLKINIKKLLFLIEMIILDTLQTFDIFACNDKFYPGIYVDNKKICSIGLRIQNGCCLHGLSLNINIDLKPFKYISPCGDNNIIMTNIININKNIQFQSVKKILINKILLFFNMQCISIDLKI